MYRLNVVSVLGVLLIAGVVVGPQLWHPYSINSIPNKVFKGEIDYVNKSINFQQKHQVNYL